jgi:hypothetical protein
MPRNLKRHYGKGDLPFVTFSCDQEKEEVKDSPFQKPKSNGPGTPTRNDRFTIIGASRGRPARLSRYVPN